VPAIADAQNQRAYKYVDEDGNVTFTDTPPPESAEMPKTVLNQQGVPIDELEGKKTEEQLAEEARLAELKTQKELQFRADKALLSTYISVEEIEMHRDRRVELFRAQARVTELYLRNLTRRLDQLKREAGRYKPYSSDPEAETIDPGLVEEIDETENAIDNHKVNLQKFRDQEQDIIEQFDGDIARFKRLKGLDGLAGERASDSPSENMAAQAVPE
jgi:hypothetical protein